MIFTLKNPDSKAPPVAKGKPSKKESEPDDANAAFDVNCERYGLTAKWRDFSRWQRRLQKSNRFGQLQRCFGAGQNSPLAWGISSVEFEADAAAALQFSYKLARRSQKKIFESDICQQQVREYLAEVEPELGEAVSSSLRSVHLAQLAPVLIGYAPTEMGWPLLEKLCQQVEQSQEATFANPRVEQLLQQELPLTLAYQLSEMESFRPLVSAAANEWEKSLTRWLDEAGTLEMRWWPQHRAIFAGWIRVYRLLRLLEQPEPADETRQRMIGLFRQTQRAACSNGETLLIPQDLSSGFRRLIRLAESLLVEKAGLRDRSKKKRIAALGSSAEAVGLTLMQTRWGNRSAKIGLQHDGQQFAMHLWRAQSLLQGECFPEIRVGSHCLKPRDRWEVSCWHGDHDVQVLDLELKLDRGVCLDRTIVMGVDDEFLFMADTVSCEEPQEVTYSLDLPLAAGITARAESETCEYYLINHERLISLVLPLAAPEWKNARGSASLEGTPRKLTLQQTAKGKSLYAPLFFDLKPNRSLSARTWRPLTIARRRTIVPSDVAVGYRVRIGYKQWLLFRSFGQQEPYTVLGKHLLCEFYIGRIEPDQSITDLIRIG